MKIYVVGGSNNKFLPEGNIKKKFFVDKEHEGDNIDKLNPWYCELTGMYYMWKHEDEDIVGLEHYRRYFVQNNHIITKEEIETILKDHDIIMYKWPHDTAFQDMDGAGKGKELRFALDLVEVLHNKEMRNFFENDMKQKGVYEGNMFICRKEVIDEYCQFLFPLLEQFDKGHKFRINRIDGYIAEYMFGPWMKYKQKKIYDCPRVTLDKNLQYVLRGHV